MTRAEAVGERRAEILAATIRVLTRDGISETTTRKIAAEAAVNQAMLRYYFGSKDDLLFAVLQEIMHTTVEIVRSTATADSDPRVVIANSISAFWKRVENLPELQLIQYELTFYALRNPESARLARQQYAGYSAVIEELLKESYARAGLVCAVPIHELARFIVGGLDGLFFQFISDRDPVPVQQNLRLLIAAVISLAEGTAPPL
ncbi:MAG TPA: TetR/AcrR family transcriptional regulator [Ktedonobacteraceae bacterium]|nr:TetR/AcrR family transcriptional regulator [Ktedonobacteraceae bacterium]